MNKLSSIKNQRGQTLIEYLILISIMAIGAFGVVRIVGKHTYVKYAEIANVLAGESSPKIDGGTDRVNDRQYRKKDFSNFMTDTVR
jgi:hypothetical protein